MASFLLFPEAIVSAYYPNSLIFAAAFLALALFLVTTHRWHWVFPAIALGCAFWMRVDAVLAFPALLFLRRGEGPVRPYRAMILMFIASGVLGLWASHPQRCQCGASAPEFGGHLQSPVDASQGLPMGLGSRAFRTLLGFFPIVTLLVLVLGVVHSVRTRRFSMLVAGMLPLLILLLLHRANLTTPKYLVYAIPFLVLLTAPALAQWTPSWVRGHRVLSVVIVLCALQAVIGIRMVLRGERVYRTAGLSSAGVRHVAPDLGEGVSRAGH